VPNPAALLTYSVAVFAGVPVVLPVRSISPVLTSALTVTRVGAPSPPVCGPIVR
jgi:hypothetical protein